MDNCFVLDKLAFVKFILRVSDPFQRDDGGEHAVYVVTLSRPIIRPLFAVQV